MTINWKVRFGSYKFWAALIPALFLLGQAVAAPFGYKWNLVVLNQDATGILNAAFGVLSILGIVTDPTTPTLGDSAKAQTYGPIVGSKDTEKDAQIDELQKQLDEAQVQLAELKAGVPYLGGGQQVGQQQTETATEQAPELSKAVPNSGDDSQGVK